MSGEQKGRKWAEGSPEAIARESDPLTELGLNSRSTGSDNLEDYSFENISGIVDGHLKSSLFSSYRMPIDEATNEITMTVLNYSDRLNEYGVPVEAAVIMIGSSMLRGYQLGRRA